MGDKAREKKQFSQRLEKAYSSVAFQYKEDVFSVLMWRNHIPKVNVNFPSEVLVLSHKRSYTETWRFTIL